MKKVLYGFGGLSYSVINQTIANFFMFFATSVLGLQGTFVGVIIGISTVWDGISDAVIGYLSDNYPLGKLGRRNGYMLIASIGMAVFNIALWCIPNSLSLWVKFVWLLISLVLIETFSTMFATPYTALANDLAKNNNDRTKYNSSNTIFYLIGIIIPSALMVVFLPNTEAYPIGQLNPNGYIKIAIVTSIICFVFGVVCSFTTNNRYTTIKFGSRQKFGLKVLTQGFLRTIKNARLRPLILGYICASSITVFLCGIGLHFFTYSLFYSSKQITALLFVLILGNIISQPLWLFISQKIRKKPALILGFLITILSVFGIIGIYFFRVELYQISFYMNIVLILICGMGSGALYTFPVSLYGDAVKEVNGGNNNNASYLGSLTFASNIANSLSQLIIGVLLDIIKFDSSLAVQSLGVQYGLALILFIGVQTFLILGCFTYSGYKEKREK